MDNEVVISHLSFKPQVGESKVPFIRVNCTFKVSGDSYLKDIAHGRSLPYYKNLGFFSQKEMELFQNFQEVLSPQDPLWTYLAKFDTFWYKEIVSDCAVTRSCLHELKHYQTFGTFPSTYRFADGSIVLRHLETLHLWWD